MDRTKRIALGVGIALVVYLALLAIVSALIVKGSIGESAKQTCVWVCACIASFVGTKTASPRAETGSVAICAAALLCTIVLVGFLVNDSLDFLRALELAIPIMIGAGLTCLTRAGKGKRTRAKHHSRK